MSINIDRSVAWSRRQSRGCAVGTSLDQAVKELLDSRDLDVHLASEPGLEHAIMRSAEDALARAFGAGEPEYLLQVQRSLYHLYEEIFRSPTPGNGARNQFHPFLLAIRNKIERAWEESMRADIALTPDQIPETEEELREFVVDRWSNHRASAHPLFDYLENEASREGLASFFVQEGAVSTRFADILVLSLVGAGDEVSRYLIENLWEEMGHGEPKKRHTKLFERLLKAIDVSMPLPDHISKYCVNKLGWRGIAGYNLYIYLALHRRNYYRNMGGIGTGEWIVPNQCQKILNGCFRVGFSNKQALAFYIDHVEADTRHGQTWLEDIIVPLAVRDRDCGYQILEGIEMGLNAAAGYYDEVLETLREGSPTSPDGLREVRPNGRDRT